jgi:threonine dehydrogenase-like Zn-dependent dehydrogenase
MVYRNSESGHAHESTIIHTNHFGYDDVRDVIRQILNHRVVVGPLITHRIGVDDAPLIYGRMCDDPSDLVGITIGW